MSYFTPYFTAVMGGTVAVSGFISLVRTYGLRLVGAPIGGWLSDRLRSVSKVLIVVYIIGIVSLLALVGFVNYLTAGVLMLFILWSWEQSYIWEKEAIMLWLVNWKFQENVPHLPSVWQRHWASHLIFFLFPLVGFLIDNYGNNGYKYLFILQMVVFALGILGSLYCHGIKRNFTRRKNSVVA